jgi:hypothetical protein
MFEPHAFSLTVPKGEYSCMESCERHLCRKFASDRNREDTPARDYELTNDLENS